MTVDFDGFAVVGEENNIVVGCGVEGEETAIGGLEVKLIVSRAVDLQRIDEQGLFGPYFFNPETFAFPTGNLDSEGESILAVGGGVFVGIVFVVISVGSATAYRQQKQADYNDCSRFHSL